jgi:hypothetical protein
MNPVPTEEGVNAQRSSKSIRHVMCLKCATSLFFFYEHEDAECIASIFEHNILPRNDPASEEVRVHRQFVTPLVATRSFGDVLVH